MDTKEWQRSVDGKGFVISTARTLPLEFVQEAFGSESMYWAKPLSAAHTQTMLDNSCTLGVYRLDNDVRIPIGMARMITDYVTLAYLTDVYLMEPYRGLGMGKWIVHCCREIVVDIPELRFMVLLTSSETAQRMYSRELGMKVMGTEETLAAMGARKAKLVELSGAHRGSGAPPDTSES